MDENIDDSEDVAAFGAFSKLCDSEYNKSYGSERSCNIKSRGGRYIFNDESENGPDQVKYKCGTCKKDLHIESMQLWNIRRMQVALF